MSATPSCPLLPPGYDFTDPDVLLEGIPVAEFAALRKTAPVWWNAQSSSIFDDGGYWVISRHSDIKSISKHGDEWSTNRKGAVMRLADGVTAEQLDLTKALLINHDAPEHTRLRKIVSRLFTPRSVAAHYCIGANLARMEIKLIFDELADQVPDIAKIAEPQRLRSGWINEVKDLQVSYR